MKKTAATIRLEIFLGAAILSAHASHASTGFRLRDLKFFLELFTNWSEDLLPLESRVQTTQLTRYVDSLTRDGYARRSRSASAPTYRLTRLGILEIVTRITSPQSKRSQAEFLFLIGFLTSYRERIASIIAAEGAQFPLSLKLELQSLLDTSALISTEMTRVDHAITRMETRVHDALKTSELVRNRLTSGVAFRDVVSEAEKKYPYELNSMKPLSELIRELAPDQQRWELEDGNLHRAHIMWQPQLAILREYRRQLTRLKA
jgi:hypothetical protein